MPGNIFNRAIRKVIINMGVRGQVIRQAESVCCVNEACKERIKFGRTKVLIGKGLTGAPKRLDFINRTRRQQ